MQRATRGIGTPSMPLASAKTEPMFVLPVAALCKGSMASARACRKDPMRTFAIDSSFKTERYCQHWPHISA
jgi:hypothetical protein